MSHCTPLWHIVCAARSCSPTPVVPTHGISHPALHLANPMHLSICNYILRVDYPQDTSNTSQLSLAASYRTHQHDSHTRCTASKHPCLSRLHPFVRHTTLNKAPHLLGILHSTKLQLALTLRVCPANVIQPNSSMHLKQPKQNIVTHWWSLPRPCWCPRSRQINMCSTNHRHLFCSQHCIWQPDWISSHTIAD
jgi:hypothetical protein